MNTEDDQGSVASGEADEKQLKDEGEKEEDAQPKEEEGSSKNEPSVKKCKSSSTCKLISFLYTFNTVPNVTTL